MTLTLKPLTPCPQVNDRRLVHERMVAHVRKPDATPLLVFPEGTCVNNEYCVMFKRGAFDLGATVCPIAIKYNPFFVDAFWNSKRQSLRQHIVSARAPHSSHAHVASHACRCMLFRSGQCGPGIWVSVVRAMQLPRRRAHMAACVSEANMIPDRNILPPE